MRRTILYRAASSWQRIKSHLCQTRCPSKSERKPSFGKFDAGTGDGWDNQSTNFGKFDAGTGEGWDNQVIGAAVPDKSTETTGAPVAAQKPADTETKTARAIRHRSIVQPASGRQQKATRD